MGARVDLLRILVVREVRTRYARSAIGVAWALFPPIATALVFSALDFGKLIGGQSKWNGVPYWMFAFSGTVFWGHFSQSLTSGTASIANARDMLHKSKFPSELIPVSKSLAWLLDLAIGFALLLVLMLVRGRAIPATALLVPAVFALQLAFTIGATLFLSALNLFFRDVQFVLQVVVTILMFASDVVVPVEGSKGLAEKLLVLNPMVSYLEAYRSLLFLGSLPSASSLAPGVVGAVAAFAVGVTYFRRVAPRFPEEV